MLFFALYFTLHKSIKATFLIGFILLVRKRLNEKSIKWANMILWLILLAYLLTPYTYLITLDQTQSHGIIFDLLLFINTILRAVAGKIGNYLWGIYQLIVAILLLLYILIRIVKMWKALKDSVEIDKDSRILNCIEGFKLKRKVKVFVNEKVKVPMTYGLIRPKIILQNAVLEDDELLYHVLTHELTHIKKWDQLWNHLRYFTACVYWYNILVLAFLKYMEEDMEVLCDKLVLQRIGDTTENRKRYCLSMLKLVEQGSAKNMALKLHPTMERMKMMKKWKTSLAGILTFFLTVIVTTTAFADVRVFKPAEVIVLSGEPLGDEKVEINLDNRVKELSEEEYEKFYQETVRAEGKRSANISDTQTLGRFENREYSFNMNSWAGANHNGFTIKTSDLVGKKVNYTISIMENDEIVYRKNFTKGTRLAIKTSYDSQYTVIISNNSAHSLKYTIDINSYVR